MIMDDKKRKSVSPIGLDGYDRERIAALGERHGLTNTTEIIRRAIEFWAMAPIEKGSSPPLRAPPRPFADRVLGAGAAHARPLPSPRAPAPVRPFADDGARLKAAREKAGLSQAGLATALGFASDGGVPKMERGERAMSGPVRKWLEESAAPAPPAP